MIKKKEKEEIKNIIENIIENIIRNTHSQNNYVCDDDDDDEPLDAFVIGNLSIYIYIYIHINDDYFLIYVGLNN